MRTFFANDFTSVLKQSNNFTSSIAIQIPTETAMLQCFQEHWIFVPHVIQCQRLMSHQQLKYTHPQCTHSHTGIPWMFSKIPKPWLYWHYIECICFCHVC